MPGNHGIPIGTHLAVGRAALAAGGTRPAVLVDADDRTAGEPVAAGAAVMALAAGQAPARVRST